MNVNDTRFHRNGIGGEGFCAAIVTDPFGTGEDRTYLVITLPDVTTIDDDGNETTTSRADHTFVLSLDQLAAGDVQTRWRGDMAADVCRQAILDAARAA